MKNELESCVERLGSGLRAFPWRDRTAYGDWLAQTYWYVRHSTRLLVCGRAGRSSTTTTSATALHVRFAAHMAEEEASRAPWLCTTCASSSSTSAPSSSARRRARSTSASTTRSSTSIRWRCSATSWRSRRCRPRTDRGSTSRRRRRTERRPPRSSSCTPTTTRITRRRRLRCSSASTRAAAPTSSRTCGSRPSRISRCSARSASA